MGIFAAVIGTLIGAGAMYLLDPRMGRQRRALLRDQMTKLSNRVPDQIETMADYKAGKARGVVAETARHLRSEELSDETLVARIRAELGRYVSHPGAIEVNVSNGVVTLSGNILSHEAQPFVAKVKSMSGVQGVDNRLQMHAEGSNIPDLQGGRTRPEFR